MKFGRIVLQVNTLQLTESCDRFDVTIKMAAVTSFDAEMAASADTTYTQLICSGVCWHFR